MKWPNNRPKWSKLAKKIKITKIGKGVAFTNDEPWREIDGDSPFTWFQQNPLCFVFGGKSLSFLNCLRAPKQENPLFYMALLANPLWFHIWLNVQKSKSFRTLENNLSLFSGGNLTWNVFCNSWDSGARNTWNQESRLNLGARKNWEIRIPLSGWKLLAPLSSCWKYFFWSRLAIAP